ncbi:ArsR/SmtB family transcription factor [Labedaea rhizosphaerae]|nr:metalloregulator ArsR/SmtB family transcription factor [Labedaea rhizosphaerae]
MPTGSASPWQALADPMRRKVLARVARGPCSVTEIANDLPVSRPAVSQHLRVLLEAQLVDVHQQGRMRRYEIRTNALELLRQELDFLLAPTLPVEDPRITR